jgi:CobQ-like glutamine amidotransferase family enzyme
MKPYSLTIGWLYPSLMNVYGDRGNVIALEARCNWRNIKTSVKLLDIGHKDSDLKNCDILLMGGAQDRQQEIVNNDLIKRKAVLKKLVNSGIPGLYVCGGYQFFGKYYKEADGNEIKGLGIFDVYTENPGESAKRLIGNMGFETYLDGQRYVLIGFENHGGRTFLEKSIKPFGNVLFGNGNNGEDKTEGVRHKNSFGTYSHGPILPKNPEFTDYLIKLALEHKYNKKITLEDLNNAIEQRARFSIANRIGIRI